MAMHIINLNVTTDQLIHLNNAISDIIDTNIGAISSKSFRDELSPLLLQCEALNTFHTSIQKVLSEDLGRVEP